MARAAKGQDGWPRVRRSRGLLLVLPPRETLWRLAALVLVGLLLLATAVDRIAFPVFLPQAPPTVAEGVVLGHAGLPFGGLAVEEAETLLAALAEGVARPARAAYLDPGSRTAVPASDGLELDVAATISALLAADDDSQVAPVYRWTRAEPRLDAIEGAPILRGPPERRAVALAINVAWGGEFLDLLDEVLAVLRDEEVRATFFLVGQWAEDHPVAAREIAARGHELAAHGYRDMDLTGYGSAVARDEVAASQRALREIAEAEPRWFSPPYGAWHRPLLEAVEGAGLRMVLWSIDTVDWQRPGVAWMLNKVRRELHPGAIVLTHPTEQVPELLRQFLPWLQDEGYRVVPVGQLLDPAWEPDLARLWAELHGDAP